MADSLEQEIRTLRSLFWSDRDPGGRGFAPLADAYRRAGQLDQAVELLQDGLDRIPDFATGHFVAGLVHAAMHDSERAIRSFEQVLELDAGNVQAKQRLEEVRRGEFPPVPDVKSEPEITGDSDIDPVWDLDSPVEPPRTATRGDDEVAAAEEATSPDGIGGEEEVLPVDAFGADTPSSDEEAGISFDVDIDGMEGNAPDDLDGILTSGDELGDVDADAEPDDILADIGLDDILASDDESDGPTAPPAGEAEFDPWDTSFEQETGEMPALPHADAPGEAEGQSEEPEGEPGEPDGEEEVGLPEIEAVPEVELSDFGPETPEPAASVELDPFEADIPETGVTWEDPAAPAGSDPTGAEEGMRVEGSDDQDAAAEDVAYAELEGMAEALLQDSDGGDRGEAVSARDDDAGDEEYEDAAPAREEAPRHEEDPEATAGYHVEDLEALAVRHEEDSEAAAPHHEEDPGATAPPHREEDLEAAAVRHEEDLEAPAAHGAEDPAKDAGEDQEGDLYTRTMGELYARQGLFARAAEVYEHLLECDPENTDFRERLDELRNLAKGRGDRSSEGVPARSERGALLSNLALDPPDRGGDDPAAIDDEGAEASAPQWAAVESGETDVSTPFVWTESEEEAAAEEPAGVAAGRPIRNYFAGLLSWVPGAVPIDALAPDPARAVPIELLAPDGHAGGSRRSSGPQKPHPPEGGGDVGGGDPGGGDNFQSWLSRLKP